MNLSYLNLLARRLCASRMQDGACRFKTMRDLRLFIGIARRMEGIVVDTNYALMSCTISREQPQPYKAILGEKLHELIRMAPR